MIVDIYYTRAVQVIRITTAIPDSYVHARVGTRKFFSLAWIESGKKLRLQVNPFYKLNFK